MDCFEVLYPDRQLVAEVDWSAGHGKRKDDGLDASKMNVGWGGSQARMRSTTIQDGCLGGLLTTLSIGDVQHMVFQEDDPPPFDQADAPKYDTTKVSPAVGLSEGLPSATVATVVRGYVGKAKGLRQVLNERGYDVVSLKCKAAIVKILAEAPDFRDELTLVEEVLVPRGHILIKSPKCHPEVAGLGIEYLWGRSKQVFRRETNDCTAANLHANVLASLDPTRLSLDIVRRVARRTRDYLRVYEEMSTVKSQQGLSTESAAHAAAMAKCTDPSLMCSYPRIERMLKERKTHRNIADLDMSETSCVTKKRKE